MIQEKDFLYRVPVKTAPITTPGGQIRNPEILVDLEGGEFMHGNILDANSTSKLVNQSVKEAVDNKLIESGYVTKDLLDAETTRATEQENSLKTLIGAETSARTKGDEDLSSKIKAEQTRAEGKEKEISDKLAIVNGDSNTEGSFRKAIADVVAAAPEDLDTLKEIADKLAGNDDLHTALNQAITEKADASALANEVSRATGVENNLKTAIDGKADATALSNYVLTTALNQQVDTLNAAISTKQNAGNYIPYTLYNNDLYEIPRGIHFSGFDGTTIEINQNRITVQRSNNSAVIKSGIVSASFKGIGYTYINPDSVCCKKENSDINFRLDENGVQLRRGDNNHVLTSHGSTIDITEYAKKTDIPEVDTSDFVSKTATDAQSLKSELSVSNSLHIIDGSNTDSHTTITCDGISNADNNANHVYATDGSLADLTQYAKKSEITAGGNVKDIVINGESIVENNVASIAFSTKNNVGVVQVGDGLNVNPFGTISVDTTALTALQKKVAANTAAISGKQDAGRYITYEKRGLNDDYCYIIAPSHYIECRTDKSDDGKYNYSHMGSQGISVHNSSGKSTSIDFGEITIDQGGDASNEYHLSLTPDNIASRSNSSSHSLYFQLNNNGVTLEGGRDDRVLTSNGSTIDITQYALKSELPTVPTKVSELQNDSEFIVKSVYDEKIAALEARIAALEAKHQEATA